MTSTIETLLDLFTRVDFLTGAVAGGLLLLALVAVRSDRRSWWGLALAAATIAAAHITYGRRLGLVLGLLILAAGGLLLDANASLPRPIQRVGAWALIGAGALVVTLRGGLLDVMRIQIATPAAILFVGYWLRRWSTMERRSLLGVMMAISAFGIWSTVPDTETARILLGASLPLSVATTSKVQARVSSTGAFALAGTIAWVAATGGVARQGSIVGAWASLALLVLLPMVVGRLPEISSWVIVTTHIVLAFVAARVIGLWDSALMAAIGVAVAWGLFFATVAFVAKNRETLPSTRPP